MVRVCVGVLLVAGSLAIVPTVATAGTVTIYVSPCNSPCQAIQDAIDTAESSYAVPVVIDVEPGEYQESDKIPEGNPDTDVWSPSFSDLTIQGIGSSPVVLNSGGSLGDLNIYTEETGSVTINGITISGGRQFEGGGISSEGSGSLTLNDDTISGNSAGTLDCLRAPCPLGRGFGGGIYNTGSLILDDDTISTNATGTSGDGGGIYSTGGVTLNDDTVSGNSAPSGDGGGIYDTGSLTVDDVTIADNTASVGLGSGIFNESGTVAMSDSLLANNVGGNCSQAVTTDNNFNVADDGTCFGSTSTSKVTTSPAIGLLPLAANGSTGPQTEAITDSSSAFDEVPQSACTLNVDERGLPRPGDGPNCDAGAFELQATAPPPTSTTTTSTTTVTNGRRPPPLTTGAVISLNPPLGPPGQVTTLTGSGFQNGANVTLTWDPDIGATPVHLVAAGGKLNQSVVIFAHDQLGPTILVASVNGAAQASTKYLVVPNSMEPSGPTDGLFRP